MSVSTSSSATAVQLRVCLCLYQIASGIQAIYCFDFVLN